MKMRHAHGMMVELAGMDEPNVVQGSLAPGKFRDIEHRIAELRALLAKGNQTLGSSRELLKQLAQWEFRWADWLANGLIKSPPPPPGQLR